jgi:hypothetical protein
MVNLVAVNKCDEEKDFAVQSLWNVMSSSSSFTSKPVCSFDHYRGKNKKEDLEICFEMKLHILSFWI